MEPSIEDLIERHSKDIERLLAIAADGEITTEIAA